ncbi:hypothetical protein AKJ16_DCAP01524, partial [Drosera capensis]
MIRNKHRRSVSFPIPNPSRPSSSLSSSNYNRSTSLPIPKHLIDHLTSAMMINQHDHDHDRIPWILDSLVKLTLIHDSLCSLLCLPHSQAALSSLVRCSTLHKLLQDSLVFVDCFWVLRDCLLELKHELVTGQVALRRKDDSHLGTYLKAQMRVCKNISKLRSTILSVDSFVVATTTTTTRDHVDQNDELVHVMGQVHELTVSVSGAVFEAIAGSFFARKGGTGSTSRIRSFKGAKRDQYEGSDEIGIGVESVWGLRKNGDDEEMRRGVLRKMREVEDWVDGIEGLCERSAVPRFCTIAAGYIKKKNTPKGKRVRRWFPASRGGEAELVFQQQFSVFQFCFGKLPKQ